MICQTYRDLTDLEMLLPGEESVAHAAAEVLLAEMNAFDVVAQVVPLWEDLSTLVALVGFNSNMNALTLKEK